MSVASLDLCKELYELSGWDDTDYINQLQFDDDTPTKKRIVVLREDHSCSSHDHKPFPAYDLGYLMRKLPPSMARNHVSDYWMTLRPLSVNQFEACYRALSDLDMEPSAVIYRILADTPEDAACKLAIELFKQGILTKEKI